MLALVDGNNFYASCERVFQPELRGRPLVVLSNNDGCCIARSDEAKALGVKMAQPIHLVPPQVRRQLAIRSANFTLYGDMSGRIVAILRDAVPRVDVYSIDESFLDLTGIPDQEGFAHELRQRIHRWTGIPNCIGIGPTKTLAKLANRLAKQGNGVFSLEDEHIRNPALAVTPVGDVWGVGPRYAERLAGHGITTAAQLRDASIQDILTGFGATLARTVRELRGQCCLALDDIEPDRQQIMVSRTFGDPVDDREAMGQALATFLVRAAEKLRSRGLVAAALGVFASTDRFKSNTPQHHPSKVVALPAPTADTRLLLDQLRQSLSGRFLRVGVNYRKAGVWLTDLARPQHVHADLFSPATVGNEQLMSTLDAINRRFGRGRAGFGASGWKGAPAWKMRQEAQSRRYTTCVDELPVVRC